MCKEYIMIERKCKLFKINSAKELCLYKKPGGYCILCKLKMDENCKRYFHWVHFDLKSQEKEIMLSKKICLNGSHER